jgi:hypothetical protein
MDTTTTENEFPQIIIDVKSKDKPIGKEGSMSFSAKDIEESTKHDAGIKVVVCSTGIR